MFAMPRVKKKPEALVRLAIIRGLRDRFPAVTQDMLARAGGLERSRYTAFESGHSQLSTRQAIQEFARCWGQDELWAMRLLERRDPETAIRDAVPVVRPHVEAIIAEEQLLQAVREAIDRLILDKNGDKEFANAALNFGTWYMKTYHPDIRDVDRVVEKIERGLLRLAEAMRASSGHHTTKLD